MSASPGPDGPSAPSLTHLLSRLQDPTLMGSSRKDVLSRLTSRLKDADAGGISADQIHHLLSRVVLSRQGKACTPTQAVALVNSIHPARGELLQRRSVLLILGVLGGSLGRLGKGGKRGGVRDDTESDESETDEPRVSLGGRREVGIKVQAALLKLLILLHDPPITDLGVAASMGEIEDDLVEDAPSGPSTSQGVLPPTLLSKDAIRALEGGYAVLWHCMDYLSLRANVCHLLCKLTRRKHVKQYRIAKLLTMRLAYPNDPSLLSLLQTFASYSPSLLFADTTLSSSYLTMGFGSSSGSLKYPSMDWLERTLQIWRDEGGTGEGGKAGAKRAKLASGGTNKLAAMLPSAIPLPLSRLSTSRLLLELEDPATMGYSLALDKIALPPQAGAALGDASFALLVLAEGGGGAMGITPAVTANRGGFNASRKSNAASLKAREINNGDVLHYRVSAYIQGAIEDCLPLQGGSKRLAPLLEAAARFYERHGVLSRHAEGWMRAILDEAAREASFDPSASRAVAKLFGLLGPRGWTEMQAWCEGMERMAHKGRNSCAIVLDGFNRLLRSWGREDWVEIHRGLERASETYYKSLRLQSDIDYVETINETANFAAKLGGSALAVYTSSVELHDRVLTLHETLSRSTLSDLTTAALPSLRTVHFLSLSPSATVMTISRLSGQLQSVRTCFERYTGSTSSSTLSLPRVIRDMTAKVYATERTEMLNFTVVAVADLVWRNRAMLVDDAGTQGGAGAEKEKMWRIIGLDGARLNELKKRTEERGDQLGVFASMTHGPAFIGLAERFANDLAKKNGATQPLFAGPLSTPALREARASGFPSLTLQELRTALLGDLSSRGAKGLKELLFAVISSLSAAPKAGATGGRATTVGEA